MVGSYTKKTESSSGSSTAGGRLVRADVFSAPASELEAEAEAAAASARLAETPGSVTHLLAHLPQPEVDEADFRGEVARPLEEVMDRFKTGHPEVAFRKLFKAVAKEEER